MTRKDSKASDCPFCCLKIKLCSHLRWIKYWWEQMPCLPQAPDYFSELKWLREAEKKKKKKCSLSQCSARKTRMYLHLGVYKNIPRVSGKEIAVRDSMPKFSFSIYTFAYNLSMSAHIIMEICIFHLPFKTHPSHTSKNGGKCLIYF